MTEIQGKSILVRVSARFELSGVDCNFKQNMVISLDVKNAPSLVRSIICLCS